MAYHPITPDEVRGILGSDPPHTGKLATVCADGRPHVVPIWFVADPDGSILFNTGEASVKGANLRRSGRAALCVDDERPPYTYLMVEGPVVLIDDLDQVRAAAGRIGGRYMGADRAEEFADRNGVLGELLVVLRPSRVTGAVDLAG
jgi:PPOX class probable F420-dependent enzyme